MWLDGRCPVNIVVGWKMSSKYCGWMKDVQKIMWLDGRCPVNNVVGWKMSSKYCGWMEDVQ